MKTVSNVTQQQRESDGSPGLANAGSIRPHLQAQFLPDLGICILLFFFSLSVLGMVGGGGIFCSFRFSILRTS